MSYQTNANALLNLLQSSQQYASQKDNSWAKFTAGTHKIRILPPWSDEGTPTRMLVQHFGYKTKDNYERAPLCFNYVFSNENIAKALMLKNVIKKEDLELFGKLGCIYCKISDLLIQLKGKKNNRTYPKPSFLWNIINRADNKVYKWTTSKKLFEGIAMFASACPQMFDLNNGMDIFLMAQGEGMTRKYSINLIQVPSPIGIDLKENPLHDLDQAMADGYRNLNDTIELILNTYPETLPILGIDPSKLVTNVPF